MTANTSLSGLSSKISKAHDEVKDEETRLGSQNLPGGINNGIARLSMCKFDIFKTGNNQGEFYFMAMGVVVSPDKNDAGIPVKGLQTKVGPLPICATQKRDGTVVSLQENLSNVYNELRKLGVNTADITPDDLEATVDFLKESKPYFRFSTNIGKATEQYPNPRVWENWHGAGGLEDYDPDSESGEPDEDTNTDNTVDVPEDTKDDSPDTSVETTTDKSVEPDLQELAEAADSSTNEPKERGVAQEKLQELAMAAGVPEEEIDEAADWASVVTMMSIDNETDDEPTEAVSEDEDTSPPEKGDVVFFKPNGKRKYRECTVSAVFAKSEKCNLKDLETKESYKQVKFSELKDEI